MGMGGMGSMGMGGMGSMGMGGMGGMMFNLLGPGRMVDLSGGPTRGIRGMALAPSGRSNVRPVIESPGLRRAPPTREVTPPSPEARFTEERQQLRGGRTPR